MTTSATALIEELADLDARLAAVVVPELQGDSPRGMADTDVLALARVAESIGRRGDALRAAAAGEVSDRSRPERGDAGLSSRLGCANAAELIVRLTGVASATARDRIRMSRAIATTTSLSGGTLPAPLPVVRDAFNAGRIGVDTVDAISRTLGRIADRCDPVDLAAAEAALVGAAVGADDTPGCGADDTLIQAKVWALVLDPDGILPENEQTMRRRRFTLGRIRDGLVPVNGAVLPDVAGQLQRLFDAHLSPRVEDHTLAPLAGGPEFRPVDDVDDLIPHDERTRAQKQHDVLASILGVAGRAAETPTLGGAAPTLLVTIPAADLDRHDGVGLIDGTDTTVPAYVARHIACSGGIQRLVFDDTGRIIELGSPRRVYTAHQRRAITFRDGGCIIPGCHVPAVWCEIHHVVEASRGGPTHIDNGVMLCWYHHRTLETNGWSVRIEDGVPEVRAPHWIDGNTRWRPARGSTALERERLRRRRTG